MNVKKISRKLKLNKKTIANLNLDELKIVHGGGDLSGICPPPTEHSLCCTINGPTCDTCDTQCGTCAITECGTCPTGTAPGVCC